jgi:hypothetical protein
VKYLILSLLYKPFEPELHFPFFDSHTPLQVFVSKTRPVLAVAFFIKLEVAHSAGNCHFLAALTKHVFWYQETVFRQRGEGVLPKANEGITKHIGGPQVENPWRGLCIKLLISDPVCNTHWITQWRCEFLSPDPLIMNSVPRNDKFWVWLACIHRYSFNEMFEISVCWLGFLTSLWWFTLSPFLQVLQQYIPKPSDALICDASQTGPACRSNNPESGDVLLVYCHLFITFSLFAHISANCPQQLR